MSTITSLNANDNGATSRGVINTNFTNLNTDKLESSTLGTTIAAATAKTSPVLADKVPLLDSAASFGLKNSTLTAVQAAVVTRSYIDAACYAASSNGSDTYTINISPNPPTYYVGMVIFFTCTTPNTGAATMNVSSLGAKSLVKNYNTPLSTGDIVAGQMNGAIYDGANFQIFTTTAEITQRVNPRENTITSSGTPSIDCGTTDIFTITALATAITAVSVTGTPVAGQKLIVRIKDNGTARAIAWGASFVNRGGTLPLTTVLSKVVYVGLIYNSAATVWDCVATSQEV